MSPHARENFEVMKRAWREIDLPKILAEPLHVQPKSKPPKDFVYPRSKWTLEQDIFIYNRRDLPTKLMYQEFIEVYGDGRSLDAVKQRRWYLMRSAKK